MEYRKVRSALVLLPLLVCHRSDLCLVEVLRRSREIERLWPWLGRGRLDRWNIEPSRPRPRPRERNEKVMGKSLLGQALQ